MKQKKRFWKYKMTKGNNLWIKSQYRRVDLEIGKEMPDFSLLDFRDPPRSLKEFRGKYILVNFWGMRCADYRPRNIISGRNRQKIRRSQI